MGILVVGSVALDSVKTPFGQRDEVLGGAATYFGGAASYFADVSVVAVVGDDFPKEHVESVRSLEEKHNEALCRCFAVAKKLALDLNISESGFRIVINSGDDGGQTVHHLHVHLLGGRGLGWPPG